MYSTTSTWSTTSDFTQVEAASVCYEIYFMKSEKYFYFPGDTYSINSILGMFLHQGPRIISKKIRP